MANVKIDCTQIPRVQMDILCRTLLAGIERFYSDPENLRRYEAWLQKCREEGKFYDDDTQTAAPAVQYLNENTFAYDEWKEACRRAETAYFNLLNWGLSPQEARAVLPNSLKTEVVMTANIREWRHFLRLRTSTGAHPQIREIATPLLRELQRIVPICFDDILPKEGEQ